MQWIEQTIWSQFYLILSCYFGKFYILKSKFTTKLPKFTELIINVSSWMHCMYHLGRICIFIYTTRPRFTVITGCVLITCVSIAEMLFLPCNHLTQWFYSIQLHCFDQNIMWSDVLNDVKTIQHKRKWLCWIQEWKFDKNQPSTVFHSTQSVIFYSAAFFTRFVLEHVKYCSIHTAKLWDWVIWFSLKITM